MTTTLTAKNILAGFSESLKNEKMTSLHQVSQIALLAFLSPKNAEASIKSKYVAAGYIRPNKDKALTQIALHRIKAGLKVCEIRKETILNLIETASNEGEATERLTALIVKEFLPSASFPLYVGSKFMPMLLLGLSANETKELLAGKGKAQAADSVDDSISEELEEVEGGTVDANPEITLTPAPATIEEQLDSCIARFYELAFSVKNTDIEALAKINVFADTITNANLLLHNIHEVKTPQNEAISFVNGNEALTSKFIKTLVVAVINIKPKITKRKKVYVNDIVTKIEELEAKYA